MSLAQTFNPKKIDPNAVRAMANDLALKIRSVCTPAKIILFGSAAEGRFKEGSDLDLLLVFSDLNTLRAGRAKIRTLGRLSTALPVDLIFVSSEQFESKKNIGGVCFIAAHNGKEL